MIVMSTSQSEELTNAVRLQRFTMPRKANNIMIEANTNVRTPSDRDFGIGISWLNIIP
jgi:hypothetical protein